jgi:hypothetical protein
MLELASANALHDPRPKHQVVKLVQGDRIIGPRVGTARHLPEPTFYDMIVVWDYLRRERPWAAKPTKVQLRGEGFDSIRGNKIRILFSYSAKYLGDLQGNVELSVTGRSDTSIMLITDDEGIENALLRSKMFLGIIDGTGRRFMAPRPIETRKVAPADYRSY